MTTMNAGGNQRKRIGMMTGLFSEQILLALIIVALTLVIVCIFYPAVSLPLADSIAIDEEDFSTEDNNNQGQAA